jgi:hypothetical protein
MDQRDLKKLNDLVQKAQEDAGAYAEEHSIVRHQQASSEEPDAFELFKAAVQIPTPRKRR